MKLRNKSGTLVLLEIPGFTAMECTGFDHRRSGIWVELADRNSGRWCAHPENRGRAEHVGIPCGMRLAPPARGTAPGAHQAIRGRSMFEPDKCRCLRLARKYPYPMRRARINGSQLIDRPHAP